MSFVLNDTMQHALRSVSRLDDVKEYGLKGLNVVTVKPDNSINLTDDKYYFTLDSSKLSGNIPINRVEINGKLRVSSTGPVSTTAVTYDATAPYSPTAPIPAPSYLMSASNGGLESMVLNKMFSNITLSDKQVQFIQESRTPEKIEIMSRLLEENNLKECGIYLDDTYGGNDQKMAGQFELFDVVNPASSLQVFPKGGNPDCIMEHNRFWKQNTNNQYIKVASNKFYNGTTLVANAPVQAPQSFLNKNGTSYYRANGVATKQVQEFDVKEDLCHDILVTKYQKQPVHAGIPTTDLVFTFSKSTLIDSLYKTSNTSITDITVEIVSLELKVLTFNYGLLKIPVNKPYFVPFYSEQANQETVQLDSIETVTNYVTQTRQYNSVPQYISLYCQEPSSSSGINQNLSSSFTPAKITDLKLQIDNDIQTPLWNASIDELKFRTLTNLADCGWNVKGLLENMPQNANGVQALVSALNNSDYVAVNNIQTRSAITALRSFLDGYFLLKVDKDIRLPANMCVGQDIKVSFTWTASFDALSNAPYMNNATNCVFYTTAYFPSMYKVSAERGLLKAEKLVIRDSEFWALVEGTNRMVEGSNLPNLQAYSSQNPLLIGSGFGQLWQVADKFRKYLPIGRKVVHHLSNLAEDVADEFDGPVSRKVGSVASIISNMSRGKSGRPKKLLR